MRGEICISKSRSLFPRGSGREAQGSFALQHMFVSVFGGFEVAFQAKCSSRMVNRGGVLSLRTPASYKVSLSLLIARHTQQKPLALEMKKHICNSSSVLLLKHLRHVWLGLFQERSNLCCSVLGHKAKAAGNETQPANIFATITFVFESHVALIICP